MGKSLDLPAAERLAKLIRLLDSDQPGEVTAAVAAMKRTLKEHGLDLHALAKIVTNGDGGEQTKAARATAYRDGYREGYGDALDRAGGDDGRHHDDHRDEAAEWHEIARAVAAKINRLKLHERDFAQQMVAWTERGRVPSAKQARWLDHLYANCHKRRRSHG